MQNKKKTFLIILAVIAIIVGLSAYFYLKNTNNPSNLKDNGSTENFSNSTPKTMNNPKTNETAEILSYANQIPPDQVTVTTNVVLVIIKVKS
ncbi:MAG: hypothetical protein Q8M92_02450 [Candidatus Subteraquimicrobiales bacterium]|nr:hypothetical protein [Candidatus Subteraquimicrobiales bacterium]